MLKHQCMPCHLAAYSVVWALITLGLCLFATLSSTTFAAEHNDDFDEVVYINAEEAVPLSDLVKSIDLIDRKSIEASAARSLPELLSTRANIGLSSFSGNAKRTSIDIRGSGATSVSNVRWLIDGQIIPNNDLGGVDLTEIPLESIARIDVIRGANSVRYGSGASQGIVNIITQKPTKSTIRTAIERGSFDTYNQNALISFVSNHNTTTLNLVRNTSSGYRERNTLNVDNLSLHHQLSLNDLTLNLRHSRYSDYYQLPGPLELSKLITGELSPRASNVEPLQEGNVNAETNSLNALAKLKSIELSFLYQYRDRQDTPIEISGTGVQRGLLQTTSHFSNIEGRAQYDDLSVTSGITLELVDYLRIITRPANAPRIMGAQVDYRSRAYFIQAAYVFTPSLSASIGYRSDNTKNRDLNSNERRQWNNEAYEIGSVFRVNSASVYVSAAKTFRNPNGDEIQLQSDEGLEPQTAERYQAGLRINQRFFSLAIGLYKSLVEQEIIFRLDDSGGSTNLNLDQRARRQGIESSISWDLNDSLALELNYGQLSAELTDGSKIPLVSERTASATLTAQLGQSTSLSWHSRYFSERFDGNDFSNTEHTKLPSVTTHNASIIFTIKKIQPGELKASFSVNNIFDEQFVTASYSGSAYPHPGINLAANLTFTL